jgi:hypothetical protein
VGETQRKKILLIPLNQIEDGPILPAGGRAVAGSNPVSPIFESPANKDFFSLFGALPEPPTGN